MSSGDLTASRTRGTRGYSIERGMTRDDGVMRGRVAGRWEAAAQGESTQQLAGLEAQEAMAWRGA
jgi:hypothetical protein